MYYTTFPAARLCYNVRQMTDSSHVGIRELRQNLSVYLRRIARGERFEVTDRGKPVALLVALPANATPLERLVAEGRVRPPEVKLADLERPPGAVTSEVGKTLLADRDERVSLP